MNKKIKFLIAICLGFGVGFLFDNNFAFSNSLKIKFHCDINVDQNTNNSDIKDSAPKKIEISYFENKLYNFIWDGQKLHKHFEILSFDSDLNVELETSGYSDIKNAVFFNIDSNIGYLTQHNLSGVYYNCIKTA